jgi:hypothetical protein
MSTYTDRGVREIAFGLREAKAALARRRSVLQAKMGAIEAELSDLGKMEAAYDGALEVLRAEQARREKAKAT